MRTRKYALGAALTALVMLCGCNAAPAETATPAESSVTAATDAPAELTGTDVPQTAINEQLTSPAVTSTLPGGYIPRSELLDCNFFDAADFNAFDAGSTAYDTGGEPLCGVAPHHLAAGHFVAGMYKAAAAAEPETVVLLAPMHYRSENVICTTDKGWNTAFGAVLCDTGLAAMFADKLGAPYDDEMVEYDHSASSHIPFIKRYLPDAKVAVLLVSPRAGRDFPERLADTLYEMSQSKRVFFAFSIDFSHYLQPNEAEKHDAGTLKAVTEGDTGTIEHFTDDNVDTPYCLSAFVRLSALLGGKITKADHGNTYTVGNMPYTPTLFTEGVTSYFVFLTS